MIQSLYVETDPPAPTETDQVTQDRRKRYARTLYQNACNETSWRLADRLVRSWGLSAEAVGCEALRRSDGLSGARGKV